MNASWLVQRRLGIAAASVGLPLAIAASLEGSALAEAGLAWLAVAGLAGAFVGVPLATAAWRTPLGDGPVDRGATALAEVTTAAVLGSVLAPWVVDAGTPGWVALVALWSAIALGSVLGWTAAAVAGGVGLVAAMAVGGVAIAEPGWTLAEPRWGDASSWGPAAVVAGILMVGAGVGQWRGGPKPQPDTLRVPWTAFGAGGLGLVAMALAQASAFELSAGESMASSAGTALAVLGLVAGGAAWVARSGGARAGLWRAAGGLVATLWFAGPAWGAREVVWATLVPVAIALFAAVVAWRAEGAYRWAAAGAGVVAGGAAIWGFPGVPAEPLAAVMAAASVVVAVWLAGTRAILVRTS